MPSPDFNEQNVHSHTTLIPDETTPLIAVENAGITSQTNAEPFIAGTKSLATAGTIGRHNGDDAEDEDDEVPLPRGQIFMLCVARTVEPIAVSIHQSELVVSWNTHDSNSSSPFSPSSAK